MKTTHNGCIDLPVKLPATGLPIHLVGVEFSRESRNVVAFEVETLQP